MPVQSSCSLFGREDESADVLALSLARALSRLAGLAWPGPGSSGCRRSMARVATPGQDFAEVAGDSYSLGDVGAQTAGAGSALSRLGPPLLGSS